jgi:hypothetical protein
MGDASSSFFSPPLSLAVLFEGFPPGWVATLLNVILAGFLAMLLAGWRTRTASLGTGLTFIVLKSFEYSIGKINHDILLALPPLVLAFSNWGDALSIDSRRRPGAPANAREGQWPLTLLAALMSAAMFTAGWAKAASGWLDPQISSTYGQLMANYWVVGRDTLAARLALSLGPNPLWELVDWASTVLELVFVVAMFHARLWQATLAVACLFHVGIWLLFDIVFETNLVAYAAFLGCGSTSATAQAGGAWARLAATLSRPAWTTVYPGILFALSLAAIGLGRPPYQLLHLPLDLLMIAGGVVGTICLARLWTGRRGATQNA